jgi:DNA invertase Pin-like site-specific DNA recombinase
MALRIIRRRPPVAPTAIGYLRVSTEEQATSGLGLEAQKARLSEEAERRGWQITFVTDAAVSGSIDPSKRPGLSQALRALAKGEAQYLLALKVDRVSRSLHAYAALVEQADREGWALVTLDAPVDATTAAGKLMSNVLASVAAWERDVIRERTTSALQAKKARGERLGRPVTMPYEVRERIVAERAQGLTLQGIADRLTADGIPTARGGTWAPASILAVLRSIEHDRAAEQIKA